MINFYELLGISETASEQEIKTAYRNMVKKYHPDINKSDDANKIIRSLNEAKETLLNETKRRDYDQLLHGIKHSKQVSKEKEQTYKAKTDEYKETYKDVYVTRWQFFKNYLKNGLDSKFTKIIKSIIVGINLLLFSLLKGISLVITYLFFYASSIIDYVAIILILIAILSTFLLKGNSPDYVSFMSAKAESFCIFFGLGIIIEILKIVIFKGSINLHAYFQNLHDKILVSVLMK